MFVSPFRCFQRYAPCCQEPVFLFLFPRPTFSCIRLLSSVMLAIFSAAKQGSLREEGPLFRTPRQIETSTIDIFQDDKAFFSKIACHCSPSKAALAHWCLAVGGSSWWVVWPTAEGRKSTNETRRDGVTNARRRVRLAATEGMICFFASSFFLNCSGASHSRWRLRRRNAAA